MEQLYKTDTLGKDFKHTPWLSRRPTNLRSDMIFNIRQQISYLSKGTTLEAGTIFLTGTPAGIGYFRKPAVVLEDGSQFSVYIEKIGTLVNKIRYE